MSTLTMEQQNKIAAWLDQHPTLAVGLGTKERACSVAAINLALTGKLTDTIPECMSPVVGRWIIRVQDAMPAEIRDSVEWRTLLPLAAGTGREFENERRAVIMEWMWGVVLPSVQPVADAGGFGVVWAEMCEKRTTDATQLAAAAAANASAATNASANAAHAAAWAAFDPVGVLRQLIEVAP
jgi:hypothetical protein